MSLKTGGVKNEVSLTFAFFSARAVMKYNLSSLDTQKCPALQSNITS